jgi:hypothetical protein
MALLWLKPLAARTIAHSDLLASVPVQEIQPEPAKGVA